MGFCQNNQFLVLFDDIQGHFQSKTSISRSKSRKRKYETKYKLNNKKIFSDTILIIQGANGKHIFTLERVYYY